jgi:hypothetical protein
MGICAHFTNFGSQPVDRFSNSLPVMVPTTTADRNEYYMYTYALAIFLHIHSSLINMRCLHILPHI